MSGLAVYVISGEQSVPLRVDGADVVLESYELTSPRMGAAQITAELRCSVCLDDVWTYKEYVDVPEGRFLYYFYYI